MTLLLTTDLGLESLLAEEVRELLDPEARFELLPGRVVTDEGQPVGAHWRDLRLTHELGRVIGDVEVGSLDDLRAVARGLDLDWLRQSSSFRVTASGETSAGFSRREAAGAVGAVLQEGHGTAVDLTNPEATVRLDLIADRALLWSPFRGMLSDRIRRGRNLRSALRPTVAAAMVRMLGLVGRREPALFLDPTCGSGTIVVEAGEVAPGLELHASDWDAATVDVARATFAAHELEVSCATRDARHLPDEWNGRVDFVVTNPPFGIRLARRTLSLRRLYAELLESVARVLKPGGRVALLSPRRKAVAEAASELPLELVAEREVTLGQLRPVIHVFRRD
ncbi:MAG: THUMP domain-containing class I SAM-dependent methyltransferase [Acidobacteriota bacterium]